LKAERIWQLSKDSAIVKVEVDVAAAVMLLLCSAHVAAASATFSACAKAIGILSAYADSRSGIDGTEDLQRFVSGKLWPHLAEILARNARRSKFNADREE